MQPAPSPHVIRFGVFEVDLRSRELRKDGKSTGLPEQSIKILEMLLDRPGELVQREEIRRKLWPNDTVVEFDHGINAAVKRLRQILVDAADQPRFIETLSRRGYRWVGPVNHPKVLPLPGPVLVRSPLSAENDPSPLIGKRVLTAGRDLDTASDQVNGKTRCAAGSPRRRIVQSAIVFAVLAILASVGFGAYKWVSRKEPKLQNVELVKLTDGGNVLGLAISPDGRYVAYVLHDRNGLGLWVRQVATHSDIAILPATEAGIGDLAFSPEGDYIYFTRTNQGESVAYLYSIPVLGGPARRLLRDVDSPVSFSPNGRSFVFARGIGRPAELKVEIRIAIVDGTGDRLLSTFYEWSGAGTYPTWSPDGRTIAVSFCKRQICELETISVADGSVREIYSNPKGIGRPLWLSKGEMLLVVLYDRDNRGQLWTISYPQGEARQFTNDLTYYHLLTDIARDGRTAAAVELTPASSIWAVPGGQTSKAQQLTFDRFPLTSVEETLEGKLLAKSWDDKLWTLNADGSQRSRLADFEDVLDAKSCGRFFIVKLGYRKAKVLMRVDTDGTNSVQLLSTTDPSSSSCSPDGKFVFVLYDTVYYGTGPPKLTRIPIEGGAAEDIATVKGEYPSNRSWLTVSPDGRFLAFAYLQQTPHPAQKLAVIPATGGPPTKLFDIQWDDWGLKWSADGENLDYVEANGEVENVWEQPVTGGHRKQLTNFATGEIFDFSWTPDRSQLLVVRGEVSSDVVLLKNIQ